MVENKDNEAYSEELLDYEEEDEKVVDSTAAKTNGDAVKKFVVYFNLLIYILFSNCDSMFLMVLRFMISCLFD